MPNEQSTDARTVSLFKFLESLFHMKTRLLGGKAVNKALTDHFVALFLGFLTEFLKTQSRNLKLRSNLMQ